MVTIYVDGVAFEVAEGKNLLETCQSLGINVPYFCWHPKLHSVGACRQCAVKQFRNEQDTRGRIVMSCMTPVVDGLRVSITDPEAVTFRKGVSEWLMLNHPHDCPICDEGGECHLQDMIVMTRHNYRRTTFPKRTYVNQNLGPFIHQEMNRCIQCYRCVRFYKDYAGGDDFDALGSQDSVFFGRERPGTLESPFSGNLIEMCPTGVFTDKTYKQHYIRKWDLQQAPSICTGCSIGCNTFAAERYGTLRRIRNRFNHEVNGYFLCDRGRFGYEQVNADTRITTVVPGSSREEALSKARTLIRDAGAVIGIGSPRASVESNFLLRRLVGHDNFYAGVSPAEETLVELVHSIIEDGPATSASLQEVEQCDAVLLLGEDPVNSAPMLELALRQSVRQAPVGEARTRLGIPEWDDKAQRVVVQKARGPLYCATLYPTSVDRFATASLHRAPDDIARFAAAVAHSIDTAAPPVDGLDEETAALAGKAARSLLGAERPLIVSGTSLLSQSVIEGAAAVARALHARGKQVRQFYVVPEQNSMGLAMLAPRPLSEAVERVQAGRADLVIVVENDLERRCSEPDAEAILCGAKLLVLDSHRTGSTARAELVLPASSFAEASGTVVNNEGRAQRFFRVMEPTGPTQESWKWLDELGGASQSAATASARQGRTLEALLDEIEAGDPAFAGIKRAAPGPGRGVPAAGIPRQSFRYSGRTAISAAQDVREHRVHDDVDSPLRYSMEGRVDPSNPGLVPEYWVPGWNSVQALNRFQEEVGGPLRGSNPGVLLIGRKSDSAASRSAPHPAKVPGAFARRSGEFLAHSYQRIFGGEELSSRSPAIAARADDTFVGVSAADADSLGRPDGAVVTIRVEGESKARKLPLKRVAGLADGIILLPAGLDNWNAGRFGIARMDPGDA